MASAGHSLQKGSMSRLHSPSARFYESRSTTPSTPEVREALTMQAETIQPFGHWAVSYPDHSALPYASHCDLPHDEAQVSPRTVIPEPLNHRTYLNIPPEDRIRELREDSEDKDEKMAAHLPFHCRAASIAATPGLHTPSPATTWAAQREAYAVPSQLGVPPAQAHNPLSANAAVQGATYEPPLSSGSPYDSPYISDLDEGEIREGSIMNADSMDQDGTSLMSDEHEKVPSLHGSAHRGSVASSDHFSTHPAVLLRAIHDACLEATERYLASHHKNYYLRTGSPYGNGVTGKKKKRARASGFNPYSRPSSPAAAQQQHMANEHDNDSEDFDPDWPGVSHNLFYNNNELADSPNATATTSTDHAVVPRPSASVLANTAAICTLLWRRAQAVRHLSLRAERAALDDMHKLTVCAEVVVMSLPDLQHLPTPAAWEASPDPALAVARIIAAGRALCGWLEDDAALRKIDEALPFPWIDVDLDLDWLEDAQSEM